MQPGRAPGHSPAPDTAGLGSPRRARSDGPGAGPARGSGGSQPPIGPGGAAGKARGGFPWRSPLPAGPAAHAALPQGPVGAGAKLTRRARGGEAAVRERPRRLARPTPATAAAPSRDPPPPSRLSPGNRLGWEDGGSGRLPGARGRRSGRCRSPFGPAVPPHREMRVRNGPGGRRRPEGAGRAAPRTHLSPTAAAALGPGIGRRDTGGHGGGGGLRRRGAFRSCRVPAGAGASRRAAAAAGASPPDAVRRRAERGAGPRGRGRRQRRGRAGRGGRGGAAATPGPKRLRAETQPPARMRDPLPAPGGSPTPARGRDWSAPLGRAPPRADWRSGEGGRGPRRARGV